MNSDDLNQTDQSGLTPLHFSCSHVNQIAMDKLLATEGVDVIAGDADKNVKLIDFSYTEFTQEELVNNLLLLLQITSSVEVLDLQSVDLSQAPADLLRQVTAKDNLHKIDLSRTCLTNEQSIAVVEECIESATLKKVILDWNDLSGVPAHLLAQAARHPDKFSLVGCSLTSQQCLAVLEASSETSELDFTNCDLSEVPPQVLAANLHKIRRLGECNLTYQQCIAVVEACGQSPTLDLKKLGIDRSLMGKVPGSVLARAVANLSYVHMSPYWIQPTTEQVVASLEACVSSAKVTQVTLCHMSGVPPPLLEKVARKLVAIDLEDATREQSQAVLRACVNQVDRFDLRLPSGSHVLQTFAALNKQRACVPSSQLREVSMEESDLKGIPVDILQQAASHLRVFTLENCKMNTEQKSGLLQAILTSSTKLYLSLSQEDIDKIPSKIISDAKQTGRLFVNDGDNDSVYDDSDDDSDDGEDV